MSRLMRCPDYISEVRVPINGVSRLMGVLINLINEVSQLMRCPD